jgi:hypothetical protein
LGRAAAQTATRYSWEVNAAKTKNFLSGVVRKPISRKAPSARKTFSL